MKNFLAIGIGRELIRETLTRPHRWTMQLSWLTAAAVAAVTQLAAVGAFAAPPAPAAYSWTGFYIGGNLGYGWGRSSNQVTFVDPFFPFVAASSEADGLNRVIGGAQLGYNWQFSPHAVWGLEADWQGSSAGASRSFFDSITLGLGAPPPTDKVTTNYESKISWFGTVRGRVGYAWDSLLLYGTGGLAYGKVSLSGTVTEVGDITGVGGPNLNAITPFSISTVKAGWAVGAGIEDALSVNWTWKVEYLYVDLGKVSGVFAAPNGFSNADITAQSRFTDNILRAGLNYRF
jgi:outer membrane immunogenic protein